MATKTSAKPAQKTAAELLAEHELAPFVVQPCQFTARQRLQANILMTKVVKEYEGNTDTGVILEQLYKVLEWIEEYAVTDMKAFDEATVGVSFEKITEFLTLYINALGE